MHVLIIGGSGQTGTLVIDEALRRGHTVTALIRDQSSLAVKNGLTRVQGTPLNESNIKEAFNATGPDMPSAVLVTLGATRASGSPFAAVIAPPRLMADSHANIVKVMKAYGIRKIVTMAAFGAGDSFPYMTFLMRWLIKSSNMSYSFVDHDLVDKEMKESGMDYVLTRPTRLTMGVPEPVRYYGNEGEGLGAMQSISRASVAVFLVDAVENSTWDRSTPVIAN